MLKWDLVLVRRTARPHTRSTAVLFSVASITTFSDLNHKSSATIVLRQRWTGGCALLQSEVARKKIRIIFCALGICFAGACRLSASGIRQHVFPTLEACAVTLSSQRTFGCGGEPLRHFKDSGACSQTDCCQSWKPFLFRTLRDGRLLDGFPKSVNMCEHLQAALVLYLQCTLCACVLCGGSSRALSVFSFFCTL